MKILVLIRGIGGGLFFHFKHWEQSALLPSFFFANFDYIIIYTIIRSYALCVLGRRDVTFTNVLTVRLKQTVES